ncbi:MAG: hypothetical protein Q4A74_05975 [Cardiobacteriaceae bacterium]|nr:hypothetical protein [Cardiobacteriaceae bacterium]
MRQMIELPDQTLRRVGISLAIAAIMLVAVVIWLV